MDKLREKIEQFTSDFAHFSNAGKAATIIIATLLLISAYFFVVKFAFWLVLLAIVMVLIGLYFVEHTNQLWRADGPRPSAATTAVPRQRHRAGCARRPPLAARLSRRTKPPRMAAPNGASADPLPGGEVGVPGRPRCPRGVGDPRTPPAPSRSGGARLWGGTPEPPTPCAGAQGHG